MVKRYVVAYWNPPMAENAGFPRVASWRFEYADNVEYEIAECLSPEMIYEHAKEAVTSFGRSQSGKHYRFSEVRDGRPIDQSWIDAGFPDRVYGRRCKTW